MAQLFVDDLTVIDCSILDHERGLTGMSWIVDLELLGELDDQGMLFDFGLVKQAVKQTIDRVVDHQLVVPAEAAGCNITRSGDEVVVEFTDAGGNYYRIESPAEAICILPAPSADRASVTDWLTQRLPDALPANVSSVHVGLRSEDSHDAWFRYSHGLRQHDGNCQRIAHGHRARLRVWENGERSRTFEQQWAERWTDIYIGTREHLVGEDAGQYRFEYNARQGRFALELPATRVYLIESESTVEQIAQHIADEIHADRPDSSIRVKAWEGVRKGAIAAAG